MIKADARGWRRLNIGVDGDGFTARWNDEYLYVRDDFTSEVFNFNRIEAQELSAALNDFLGQRIC